MPQLSVIIPAYNSGRTIAAALNSVIAQTVQNIEVIVVDDGSTDDTAQIVKEIAASTPVPSIRLVRQANAGVSAARNRAAAMAEAPYLGFLDADDAWHPEKVAAHLRVMDARPIASLTYSGYRVIDAGGREAQQGLAPRSGRATLDQLIQRNVIHSSSVVIRRDMFHRLGGFDTALSSNEDYDLWLRVAATDDQAIMALEAPLADYRCHSGQATQDWEMMHEGWLRVAARLERDHPALWKKRGGRAWGNHLEYCASLAYNAGDHAESRRLIRAAWRQAGPGLVLEPNAVFMSALAYATSLPPVAERLVGRIVGTLQKRFQ